MLFLEMAHMYQDQERLLARADLCRFIAACYYQPGPEFAEERLFDSMAATAERIDPDLVRRTRLLGDAFSEQPLEQLLVDYTRLFLGPGPVAARPYGSVWLSRENALMQESTMAVLALYSDAAFDIDEDFREVPDHVAVELEFLYLLLYRTADARQAGDAQALETTVRLRSRLFDEHLGRWIRPFTEAVCASAETAFYREVAELTEHIVRLEMGSMKRCSGDSNPRRFRCHGKPARE